MKPEFFAVTAPGIEPLLAAELTSLGIRVGESVPGGVVFTGGLADVQRANLWSRLANRVIVRVAEFHSSTFHELERRAKRIDWSRYVAPGDPVRFRVTCRKSKLYHSDAVAVRLLKASGGIAAPALAEDDDDGSAQLFVVRIAHDECTVSADSSGELLHRRGYRKAVAKAPLRETLAAALIAGSEWDPSIPLVDPMCGAGTIAIEAAMIARKIAPGSQRIFAFEKWPAHNVAKWQEMLARAREGALAAARALIIASDRDAGAIAATIANAERAGVGGDIHVSERAISDADYPQPPGWIVTNPPYGTRVGESGSLRNLYAQLGRIARSKAAGYRLAMLSADPELEFHLKLDLEEVFRTTNGGIPVRLVVA